MNGGMVGADIDALTVAARRFGQSSISLRRYRAELGSIYSAAAWSGGDAERSRHEWRATIAPSLVQASEFLSALETRLLEHASEQQFASRAIAEPLVDVGLVDGAHPGDVATRAHAAVRRLVGVSGGQEESPGPIVGRVDGLRATEFNAPSDGRDAVVGAMRGLADEGRIGRDEIEIRALDNGRYIAVLPGVTDLSAGLDQFVERVRDDPLAAGGAGHDAYDAWVDNDEPTVRKMRYAFEAAVADDSTVNEYAVAAADALEAAGVPAGADVMIIGHSFGAYAAMDLAADPTFNSAHLADPTGYHVSVTHVIAAGAETDWRLDEMPSDTNALVVNNRFDLVYRVEDVLHRGAEGLHEGHLEQNFWGGWEGKGHDEGNYIDWLENTDNDGVTKWLDAAGEQYAAAGTRVSAKVPDPNP